MSVKHSDFVEDIINLLSEDENTDPKEIMESIVAIIEDYKSELLLEKTETESKNSLSILSEKVESPKEYVAPKSSGATQRAFLLSQAKNKYYKKHGLSEEDEAEFSIAEKARHRDEINKIFYDLIAQDKNKEVDSNLKGTPFLTTGTVRRANDSTEESEVGIRQNNNAENRWKRERVSKVNREIKEVLGDIEVIEKQNQLPRVSQAVIARNEEQLEILREQLEDLKELKEQYQ